MLFATVFFWTCIKTSTQPINYFLNYHIKLAVHLYFGSLLFYVLIFEETTQQQSTFTVS